MSWQACRQFRVAVSQFAGEAVVYHYGSGASHRLSPAAAWVLDFLDKATLPVAEAELLASARSLGLADLDAAFLQTLLNDLGGLWLVERVAPES